MRRFRRVQERARATGRARSGAKNDATRGFHGREQARLAAPSIFKDLNPDVFVVAGCFTAPALPQRHDNLSCGTAAAGSGAGCNRRLFANPRHARSRAYQASSPAAFQRRVEPGECRHLELFGQVLDGGQRHLFVVVRESAFQLEELQQHGEAQSPLLRALLAKLLPVAAEAPELSEFTADPALLSVSASEKGFGIESDER